MPPLATPTTPNSLAMSLLGRRPMGVEDLFRVLGEGAWPEVVRLHPLDYASVVSAMGLPTAVYTDAETTKAAYFCGVRLVPDLVGERDLTAWSPPRIEIPR